MKVFHRQKKGTPRFEVHPLNLHHPILQNLAETQHTLRYSLRHFCIEFLNVQARSSYIFLELPIPRDYSALMQRDHTCKNLLEFLEIIRRLRAPDGCPWDREQTHESLKSYVIEETYELLEAIDSGEDRAIKEELGDVLLQIALHCQIASERGAFSFEDVVDGISRKMIYRHPHVFGETTVSSAREVEANWSKLKQEEKNTHSALDGIPKALPGLLSAHRMSERASKVGFDWPDIKSIFEKLDEETQEAKKAYRSGVTQEVLQELGDLLFVIVNLIRRLGGNAEEVMRETNRKFSRRFREMEKTLSRSHRSFGDLEISEMDEIWEMVKKREQALENHPEDPG